MVFSGFQGQGKTLSSVDYVRKLTWLYPRAIHCTNTEIKGINPLTHVEEYKGIESLIDIENRL